MIKPLLPVAGFFQGTLTLVLAVSRASFTASSTKGRSRISSLPRAVWARLDAIKTASTKPRKIDGIRIFPGLADRAFLTFMVAMIAPWGASPGSRD